MNYTKFHKLYIINLCIFLFFKANKNFNFFFKFFKNFYPDVRLCRESKFLAYTHTVQLHKFYCPSLLKYNSYTH